jgi:hypothetical protein
MPSRAALSETPASPEEGVVQRRQTRLLIRIQPALQIASAILNTVRWLAILSALAGSWLWGLVFYPFASFGRVGILVTALLMVVILLLPAGVLTLFWAGLRALTRLPDKLLAMADAGEAHAGTLWETVSAPTEPRRVRLWRFFRTVLDLRSLLLESKELLVPFAVIARVVNPVFIGVLFIAFAVSLLLMLVAVISVLVVII